MTCSISFLTGLVLSSLVLIQVSSELYEGSICRRHDRLYGICKPASQCAWIKQQSIRPNDLVRCAFNGNEAIVCCGDEIAKEPSAPYNELCETLLVDPVLKNLCEKRFKIGYRTQKACLKYLTKRPLRISSHVWNGEVSDPGDYPHVAALGFNTSKGFDFKCGGALISKQWIITAGHCVANEHPEIVRLGSIDLFQLDRAKEGQVQDIPIERSVVHPSYTKGYWYHDIALLKLAKKIEPTSYVYPVCLNIHHEFPETTNSVIVVGWGDTEHEEAETRILLNVNLTVVSLDECDQKYKVLNDRKIKDGINKGQLCAWDPALMKDACKGDSGGPLHSRLDGIEYVVGLVSFGHGCASNYPSVYTRVSQYISWIEENVWPIKGRP